MHRIETLSPALMTALRRLDADGLRAACLTACQQAFAAVNPTDVAIIAAFRQLERGEALQGSERQQLETATQVADDAYLDAQDPDDATGAISADALSRFSEARLGSALLLAFGADTADLAGDCLYEAFAALPDPRVAAQATLLTLS